MEEQNPEDPPPPAPAAGQGSVVVAGRYRVERLIARGGMAAVYLAEHIALKRYVALKILHAPPDAEEPGNFEKRFRLEAETLAGLDHPNIVTLHDYGEAENARFFLAMEYIDGPRFTDILGLGAIEPDRAIKLLLQVCAALRYAHKKRVIHRDLKPSNLLIRTDAEGTERVKVVDFGLVKVAEIDVALTREGLVLGSPHCMAPEQVRGGEIDHRADIYAIGILLFRSLTGTYPFHGTTSTSTMVAHLSEPVPSFASVAPTLQLSPQLEAVVQRCLAKKPADRYPDVATLMADLTACLGVPAVAGGVPESTQSLSQPKIQVVPEERTQPSVKVVPTPRRPNLAIGAVLLLLLLLVGGLVVKTLGDGGEPPGASGQNVAPYTPPGTAQGTTQGTTQGTSQGTPGGPAQNAPIGTSSGTPVATGVGPAVPTPPGGSQTTANPNGTGSGDPQKVDGTGETHAAPVVPIDHPVKPPQRRQPKTKPDPSDKKPDDGAPGYLGLPAELEDPQK